VDYDYARMATPLSHGGGDDDGHDGDGQSEAKQSDAK